MLKQNIRLKAEYAHFCLSEGKKVKTTIIHVINAVNFLLARLNLERKTPPKCTACAEIMDRVGNPISV